MEESETLIKELNHISFKNCENVLIGDIFYFHVTRWHLLQNENIFRAIVRIVGYTMTHNIKYSIKGTPHTICFFPAPSRKDHQIAFENVVSLIKDQVVIMPTNRKITLANLIYIFLPLKWILQMKGLHISLSEKIILASMIYKSFVYYRYIENIISKKKYHITHFLSYYDVESTTSFLTQKYNAKGITTITLQHGFFDDTWNSWSYTGSKSSYFLVDSPVSAEHAGSAGYKGNVIAVGSPHQMYDKLIRLPDAIQSDVIGIIMNSPEFDSVENIAMIRTVQDYAAQNHKRIMLKFHPHNRPEEYRQYIDTALTSIVKIDMSIDEFCELIDVAVICASTVFTTMLKKGKPVLLFARKGHDIALYENTDAIKFCSADELDKQICAIHSEKYHNIYNEFQNYFLTPGDYKENYMKAFREMGVI